MVDLPHNGMVTVSHNRQVKRRLNCRHFRRRFRRQDDVVDVAEHAPAPVVVVGGQQEHDVRFVQELLPGDNFCPIWFDQGILTEGGGSVLLTSSLR